MFWFPTNISAQEIDELMTGSKSHRFGANQAEKESYKWVQPEDARLYDRSNALWDGVDGNFCPVDGTDVDGSSDSAAQFLSNTEPSVFAVIADGSQDLRFALHVPRHCKRTAFEVVQASSTKLFDSCASRG